MFIRKLPKLVVMLAALMACAMGKVSAQAPLAKSPLKILFVGYDPERLSHEFRKGSDEFTERDSVRMPAFRELLNRYFSEVHTMDCRDWKPVDSNPFDVTVFDYSTSIIEKGSNSGGKYVPARYLPDDFSKPVVFIGSTAAQMGARIGLKLDWLCLCLDADAHHINTRHAIFNGPIEKVNPTLVIKSTPDNIYEYTSGDTVPHTIPMWTVQTKSFGKSDTVRIGLVSRGYRFQDSPDAEAISSGVCQKDVTAVALGRHGNFFLWGFAASPVDMTEEAKKVFVNAVAYIKRFNGQAPIARKYNDRMATTDDIRETAARATKSMWEKQTVYMEKVNREMADMKKKLQDKKATGATLTDTENQLLNAWSNMQPYPAKTWEEYLKDIMGPFAGQFGVDAKAYQKFMNDNIDYMYCDPKGFFSYSVDEDVKKIKVSNHSTRLIETCISMLKNNKDTALALRVLQRYTPENYTTASEWVAWYETNRSRLFFTETGGYKFLVNTLKS